MHKHVPAEYQAHAALNPTTLSRRSSNYKGFFLNKYEIAHSRFHNRFKDPIVERSYREFSKAEHAQSALEGASVVQCFAAVVVCVGMSSAP
jgi:hypothetical protein